MRNTIAMAAVGLLVACGSMATGGGGNGGAGGGAAGGSGGGASGGSGGGASGGSGGGASGGSGGGASGGSGGGAAGGSGGGGGTIVEPDSVSGTRIKAKVLTTADGAKGAWGWYDSQLAVDCNFYAAADGQTRCLPLQANVASYFADSGCSTPVAWQSCTGGGMPSYAYAARPSTSGCGPSPYAYHVYPVSGAFTGTLYVGSPGSCSMVQTPPAGYTFYSLGSELAASTFVAATITIQ